MSTRVILIDSVPNLGLPGDVVSVKPGYARNYLLPQGKALVATEGNVAEAAHQRRIAESRRKKIIQSLTELRDRLAGTRLLFTEKVSDTGRLYGSVTGRRIAHELALQFAEVQAAWVCLSEAIKAPGEYEVKLELAPHLTTTIVVEVLGEAQSKPDATADEAAGVDEDEGDEEAAEDQTTA